MDSSKPIYINLLVREQQQSRKISSTFIACLCFLVLGLGLGFWYSHLQGEIGSLQAANAQLKAELGQYKDEQMELESYRGLQAQIQAKEERLNKINEASIKCVRVYEEIEHALTDDLVATNIEISGQKVIINGYADDYQNLATLMSGLRKSPLLQKVMLLSSNIDDESGEVSFKVEMGWEVAGK